MIFLIIFLLALAAFGVYGGIAISHALFFLLLIVVLVALAVHMINRSFL